MAHEPTMSLFSTTAMDEVFSVANQIRLMVRFEWALSGALESEGLAAGGAAAAIEPFLDSEFADIPALFAQAKESGNVAIPFVRQLTAAVRTRNEEAARTIHLGATSQDVLDTALVIQSREGLALILSGVDELEGHLLRQARAHAETILPGRTWLQDGPPTTLGLKIAGWVAALRRHRQRLEAARARALVLQFGGAVGTLAALGDKGTAISAALARRLSLPEAALPWHTHRDGLGEVAAALGLLVGTLGKIARDISLLMQTEVAEVLEPAAEGRGGSSTMPHKRNPVASAVILACATRVPGLVATMLAAMPQEHERGLGNWQAEWETYPEIFRLAAAALERSIEIANAMEVNPARMLAHLEATGGLAMSEAVSVALVEHIGRDRVHELMQLAVQRAVTEGRHLREILLEMPEVRAHLGEEEIGRLLRPHTYLGSARKFLERVLGGTDGRR
jgi:3-carboxy-cis,cis-muconate cycloisomerase